MPVYDLPTKALAERACFSVAVEGGAELLVIPQGCTNIPARFDGLVYLPWEESSIISAPITPQTLIPESFVEQFPQNPVLVSSQLCGGTLQKRLEDALEQYGDRMFFCIEPMCHLLPLPCPDADPKKITCEESQRLRNQFPVFYTETFCCDYCIDHESKTVHLFDTDDTVKRKKELAESLGILHTLCLPS